VTGKPTAVSGNGWRVSGTRMDELIAVRLIDFGPDEATVAARLYFLDDTTSARPSPTFTSPRRSLHLAKMLGAVASAFHGMAAP
jgi:hypothetical protein